jgi:nucleotide-binding universal stress UspA family protein
MPMVIVGTDFSTTAASAVDRARTLAKCLRRDIEIVHVRQPPRLGAWLPDAAEREWLMSIGELASRITIRTGTPWVELVRVAEEREALIIVVGTHGRTGGQSLALGTTAARLALLSTRPTVLVGESCVGGAPGLPAVPSHPSTNLENGREEE